MNEKTQKIIGYILLSVGIILIAYGLWSGIEVYTGGRMPYEIFTFFSKGSFTPKFNIPIGGQNLEVPLEGLGDILGQADFMLNLTIQYFLILIFMSAGSKFAGIGVKLLRK